MSRRVLNIIFVTIINYKQLLLAIERKLKNKNEFALCLVQSKNKNNIDIITTMNDSTNQLDDANKKNIQKLLEIV